MPTTKSTMALYAIGLLALGAAVALLLEHTVFRQPDLRDKMQTIGTFDNWRMSCAPRTDKTGSCLLQDAIVQQGANAPVAELNVAHRDTGDLLSIVVPLGVLVPPGIKFTVGNLPPKAVAFKTCVEVGCVATLPIDAALADAMAHAKGGVIAVTGRNAKQVPIAFSLAGFDDAMAARAVDTKARNS